jgi:hypothetical protein
MEQLSLMAKVWGREVKYLRERTGGKYEVDIEEGSSFVKHRLIVT